MTEPAAPTAPAAGPSAPAPRRRRGLWIALILSLGVNLFLVGWVASAWVYGPPGGFGPRAGAGAGAPFQHRVAMRALSGENRQTVQRIWRESMPDFRARAAALREAHVGMRTAFAADQPDAKAMADAVATVKDRANGMFDHVNATLLKIAAALPAEARKAYFNAGFARARERDRQRRGPGGPDR